MAFRKQAFGNQFTGVWGQAAVGGSFTPASLSPFSWYSFRTGYVTLSGSDITAATDRSGSGKTLTPPSGTQSPTLSTDGGGRQGALYDGTDDLLRNSSYSVGLSSGWTIFALYRSTNNSVVSQIGTVNVNSGAVMLSNSAGAEIQCYTNGGGSRLIQAGLTPGNLINACHWADGTDQKLYLSGSLVQTDAGYAAPANNSVLSLGNTNNYGPLNGWIFEHIVFDRPLSPAELAQMFAYMGGL